MNNVQISKMGVVVTGKTPSSSNPRFFEPKNYMFVTPDDITNSPYLIENAKRKISEAGLQSIKSNSIDGTSVAVGCIGSDMGNVTVVDSKCATNQQINSITAIKAEFNPFYIYYSLKIRKNYLRQIAGSTTTPILPKSVFEKIELPVPSKSTQDKLVSVLLSLDDKIAFNNKINAELEQMAKMLYDYWFVQFDFPNVKGRPYKASGGKMVLDKELKREIPHGWNVGNLLDIANYVNGLACQKYRPKDDEDKLKVIKIKEIHEGFSSETEFVSSNIPEKVIIENGDVLFSWSASLEVILWAGGKGALNQHIFKITSSKYPKSFYYFQLLNYLSHFKMMAENRKTTMGHITQEHLEQSRVVLPPSELTNDLEKNVEPLLSLIVKNQEENQQLRDLRDWLLPMLMNGQVKVQGTN